MNENPQPEEPDSGNEADTELEAKEECLWELNPLVTSINKLDVNNTADGVGEWYINEELDLAYFSIFASDFVLSVWPEKRRRQEFAVNVFLESNEKDYNKNCSFRLQEREDIESRIPLCLRMGSSCGGREWILFSVDQMTVLQGSPLRPVERVTQLCLPKL